jgi:CO/xanthine dehydrogenase Mo-binding subunit
MLAAQQVREKLLRLAAHALEADAADLELTERGVQVRGAPERGLTLAEVAKLAEPGPALAAGETPGLSETAFFSADHMAYPYGVHVAEVEVDPETGVVSMLRYLIGYDIGRAVNPRLVEGQIAGGLAQGVGGVLLEQLAYDPTGQPIATTFMDYLLPTASEVPDPIILLREDAPSPLNPLGVKGAGEGGTVAASGAIANAVVDALRPFGVEVYDLPLTPDRIRQLVRAATGRASEGVALAAKALK